MKKSFTTLEDEIDELENEDSNLASSDSEDRDVDSKSQFHNSVTEAQKGVKMLQTDNSNRDQTPGVGVVLKQAPGKRIKKVLSKKNHNESININLRKVILLNIQSTMDLI